MKGRVAKKNVKKTYQKNHVEKASETKRKYYQTNASVIAAKRKIYDTENVEQAAVRDNTPSKLPIFNNLYNTLPGLETT